jgi:hypothetical protein
MAANQQHAMAVQVPRPPQLQQNAFNAMHPIASYIFLAAHQLLITSNMALTWSFDKNAKGEINPADPELAKAHQDPAAAALANSPVPKDFSRQWSVRIKVVVDGVVIFQCDVQVAHNTNALELALEHLPDVQVQSMPDGALWITGIAGIMENANDGWQFRTPEGLPYVLAERNAQERIARIILSLGGNPVLLGWEQPAAVERAIAFVEKRKSLVRPWSSQKQAEQIAAMVAGGKASHATAVQLKAELNAFPSPFFSGVQLMAGDSENMGSRQEGEWEKAQDAPVQQEKAPNASGQQGAWKEKAPHAHLPQSNLHEKIRQAPAQSARMREENIPAKTFQHAILPSASAISYHSTDAQVQKQSRANTGARSSNGFIPDHTLAGARSRDGFLSGHKLAVRRTRGSLNTPLPVHAGQIRIPTRNAGLLPGGHIAHGMGRNRHSRALDSHRRNHLGHSGPALLKAEAQRLSIHICEAGIGRHASLRRSDRRHSLASSLGHELGECIRGANSLHAKALVRNRGSVLNTRANIVPVSAKGDSESKMGNPQASATISISALKGRQNRKSTSPCRSPSMTTAPPPEKVYNAHAQV